MKEVEFSKRTTQSVRDRVDALCWAMTRRGVRAWSGQELYRDISRYLVAHGADETRYRGDQMGRAIKLLADEGYLVMKWAGEGARKRCIRIEFEPDVTLTGHSPEWMTKLIGNGYQKVLGSDTPTTVDTGAPSQVELPDIDIPVPEVPIPRYRQDELDSLLDKFFRADPDKYGDWTDKVIGALEVLTHGK